MRVAHFDCFSGISGDMTLAALVDSGVDPEAIRAGLSSLNLPIELHIEKVKRNGFVATYANVVAPEEESHRHLPEIEAIINRGKLSPSQRDLALAIFRRLAHAEAAVHGHPVEKVHFHEVGALDSIADIVGAAIGLDLLGVSRFTSRSVPPGSGTVKCAHGIMPIPTPATAELLKGVPLAATSVKAELVTPTGAAILTTVVSEWTDSPSMTIEQIGCGAGKRDFWEQPNILRLFVGEETIHRVSPEQDTVTVLETNIDDVSPEIVGYCVELLFAAGGAGCLQHSHPDEKKSTGDPANRDRQRGPNSCVGDHSVSRDGNFRHSPEHCRALEIATRSSGSRYAMGASQSEKGLARRTKPVDARVRRLRSLGTRTRRGSA